MSEYNQYDYTFDDEEEIRLQEQARREEEQKRRELEIRQEICKKNEQEIRTLKIRHAQLGLGPAASFISSTAVSAIGQEVGMLESKNSINTSYIDLQRIMDNVNSLYSRILHIEKDSQDKYNSYLCRVEQERKRQEISAGLMDLKTHTKELEKSDAKKLIPDEITNLQQLFKKCDKFLVGGECGNALTSLKAIQEAYGKACTLLIYKAGVFDKLEGMAKTIERYLRNPVYKTWSGKRLDGLLDEVRMVQGKLCGASAPVTSTHESRVQDLGRMIAEAVTDADRKQENEIIRKNVLNAVVEALREEGFTVSSPRLEAGQESDVILSAAKPGKVRPQSVHVKLGLSGHIGMDVDSGDPGDLARIREAQVDKIREKNVVCHRLAQDIKELLQNKGVRLKKRGMIWHNPDRIAKGSKDLPAGAVKHNKVS